MPGPVFMEGERVTLRTIERADLEWLRELFNHPAVWQGVLPPWPNNGAQLEERFEEEWSSRDSVELLVCVDGDPVGIVGTPHHDAEAGVAEVGYLYHPDAWGNGYATDAARRFVAYGFEQRNLHKWTAEVMEGNPASMRVLEKVGFTEEGVLRDQKFMEGQYRDSHRYGLLREEWTGRAAEQDSPGPSTG